MLEPDAGGRVLGPGSALAAATRAPVPDGSYRTALRIVR